ncbi:glucokinase [Aquabacterium sp. OR-4]|uniref:glucokinase n=1 Tax=Aquabacterium sp. OR-4 TaxID=2978127 RepID=UPI0021B40105|nr:glucokinase [Aquabacterium sp. OR-4]MDT7834206.1 glucokinase [Aquabacterium sp. OR-4]
MPATTAASRDEAAAQARDFPRLVADIGGTNARFGWIEAPGAPVSLVRTLSVPAFAGPGEAARSYLDDLATQQGGAWRAPRHAAFAVATAVAGDRVAFTNSHWDFSREAVRQALGVEQLLMLNDFEALALSLPCLGAAQLRCPDGRLPRAPGHAAPGTPAPLAVVGPGTGLGVGAVVHTRQGWVALPGEGGHATLAAGHALEAEVIGVVRRQFAHVSAERLLSGIGLPLLHQALGEVHGQPVAAPWSAEAIVNGALAGDQALCGDTVDLFCALLGSFAGNVALTLGARGGVYIGGGIVPRFADRFFASAFRERFEAKGRFQAYLAAIPTALITDTLAALTGGALAIEQQVALG